MAELPAVGVVGVVGGECFGGAAREAVCDADLVLGSARHRDTLTFGPVEGEWIELAGPLEPLIDQVAAARDAGRRTCVLTSGDPGFFGMVRRLGACLGADALVVHPAPSSVSLAFARLGLPWDHAAVVSAHGRDLDDAVAVIETLDVVAVFTGPSTPPQAVAAALLDRGDGPRHAAVVSRIGEPGETVVETDLGGLAAGTFDPMSVVVLRRPASEAVEAAPPIAWGLPEDRFEHRAGMITKAEVRAVVLGKLALPARGVLWDVGAGSGSVGLEAASLRPGLEVVAVERDLDSAARVEANATAHGVSMQVVPLAAPAAFAALPDPDRVFIGGGGLDVLDAAVQRLRPGGVVVASYAVLDRAVEAWHRLGDVVQISVSRGLPVGELGVRLAAENPVFVCWGSPTR